MNPEDVQALVARRMSQAEETLVDAHFLLTSERPAARSVVNRAYYAAFYSTLALLQTIGQFPRKHSGVIALFDREFVRPGHFSKEMSDSLHRLFRVRLEDDYERVEPVPMEEARHALEIAEQFVNEVGAYLAREGFIAEPRD
jgi:uncharacterized protein (UPF0332 family)